MTPGHRLRLLAQDVPELAAPVERRMVTLGATVCAAVTGVLLLAELLNAPGPGTASLLLVTAFVGAGLVIAASLSSRRFTSWLLPIAGISLMLLGIAAGALLPDGLDAAAVMPLAGAVLCLRAQRGRPLVVLFVVAFVASMTGETAAYVFGGMAGLDSRLDVPVSLVQSAFMLGFTYALVWWVSDRWWSATEQAQHVLASQRRLLEVNERLLSTLDPQSVLELIADSLKSVVSYDNLTIYRVDRVAGLLRPVLARDRFADLILNITFPFDRGITGWVVGHGEAQCVNDAHLDPRTTVIPGTPPEAESLIVVPLLVRGEVAGTLNMGRMGEAEAHFSAADFELARLFAGQASIALQNAEAHHAVRARAKIDALTGLLNRGAFDQEFEAALGDPGARPLCLIMLDLDGFKAYNDRRGHQSGDRLLRRVGEAIAGAIREADAAFRYGGDEFALVLRADREAAARLAERVLGSIAMLGPLEDRTVTASAGLAVLEAGGGDAEAMIAAADAALYSAKASGGDRVVTAAGNGGLPVTNGEAPRTAAEVARLPGEAGRPRPDHPQQIDRIAV